MGGEAIFFTGRGGAGRGKAKNLRDGAVFHVRNAIYMSLGYSVSVFKYLVSLEVSEFTFTVKTVLLLANR